MLDTPRLVPAPLARLIGHLPQWPHSAALSAALNVILLPRMDTETRRRLANRPLAFQVQDASIDCRLCLAPIGFLPAARRRPPAVPRGTRWARHRRCARPRPARRWA